MYTEDFYYCPFPPSVPHSGKLRFSPWKDTTVNKKMDILERALDEWGMLCCGESVNLQRQQ